MRPRRIEMQGFGAFRERVEVDLVDVDLVALVGATGSGKSTVIDAITFALYGSVARYGDNRLVAPVINQTSSEARVLLEFELAGRVHVAVRVVRRTRTGATTREARLERGDEVLAADAGSMTAAIVGLLGLDVEQFNRTVVLPQGRFADFLHDSPGERQATLRQLLGLEIYRSIGQRARADAARCRSQAEALRPELDEAAASLTDEHRRELDDAIERLVVARRACAEAVARARRLTALVDELDRELAALDSTLAELSSVSVPDGIDELGRRAADAAGRREGAASRLVAARRRWQEASGAAEAGPQPAVVGVQLRSRVDEADQRRRHAELVVELADAEQVLAEATLAAEAERAAQRELDDEVAAARVLVATARDALAGRPTASELERMIERHRHHAAAVARLAAVEAEHEAARADLEPARSALQAAEVDEAAAVAALDDLRRRAGATALVDLLAAGEPCPLCLQVVHDLPDHHVDDELVAAERRVSAATDARRDAAGVVAAAGETLARIGGGLDAARLAADAAASEVDGVADEEQLRAGLEHARAAGAASEAAERELTRALAASEERRSSPDGAAALDAERGARERVAAVTAAAGAVAERLDALRLQLAGVPTEPELRRLADDAERLATALADASAEREAAERDEEVASANQAEVEALVRAADDELRLVRERLRSHGAPDSSGGGLAEEWAAMAEWAIAARADHLDRRDEAAQRRADAAAEHRAVVAEVGALVDAAAGDGDPARATYDATADLDRAGEVLAGLQAAAEARRSAFDQALERAAGLRRRVEALDEEAVVAEALGHLLRAGGFEGWLMEAALGHLVDRATVRLLELSGGQYSLELVDRAFAVRDHANADELRSARTLSGGETFLASLSLALALADATAELAPEGAPQLESMFLDEGFGTLDPATLDVVATAIEELGASGRLVAIVTHIRELADRMPVRLEVTKVGGASTVERIEV